MKRRMFIGSALTAVALGSHPARRASAAEQKVVAQTSLEPLVWPVTTRPQPGIRSFTGHTNTVLDVVGRIGTPPSLVIFTEGNHSMALLSEEIAGVFPSWAKSQSQYIDLDLNNVVALTMPQPVVVQAIRTGGIALGDLTLDISRASGFYPDVVMGGPDPLRQLRKLGVLEPQARFFSKSRGVALLVRRGNPLGISSLVDVARNGARLAQADATEAGARAGNRAVIEQLIGKSAADAFFATEVKNFPGRLGIMHRDIPEMIACGYADAGFTHYHLVSYWTRVFPNHFDLVPIVGAERFPLRIAFSRTIEPLRARALKAFEEFFFGRARDVYPRYDFARMDEDEYGSALVLK
jgi:hypothetical protein